jgi:hypothetical protein
VSWALDGTSRAAGLQGVSQPAREMLLLNAMMREVVFPLQVEFFFLIYMSKYNRFRGCEVSIKLVETNKSVRYDFLCLILKLILEITTTEKSILCNKSIYLGIS